MIQIRMQQGLSQDARIIRQEVFVEEQGFHHEFDEILARNLLENGQGRMHRQLSSYPAIQLST